MLADVSGAAGARSGLCIIILGVATFLGPFFFLVLVGRR